ncbi:phosphate ABC transporter permease PstA [bacterium]|nr:MAG: phosphate ABC transporter permease PstA [bacterium]
MILKRSKIKWNTGYIFCWISGLLILILCSALIVYLAVTGAHTVNWSFLTTDPDVSTGEGLSGGILSPLIGTLILTTMGIMLALPWSIGMAVYLVEYGGDAWWAKLLHLGIDVLAGVPTIVIALFGLVLFSYPEMAFLSTMVEGVQEGRAFGRSFFVASITMAVMVLPYITRAIEEAIRAVPFTYKEAAYALGASKWRAIKRVVLPIARPGIINGALLGISRIAADVAIVWFLLGATLTFSGNEPWWAPQNWLSNLRGAGGTLTSYIFYASPAGDGNTPDKAQGAALVLITIILIVNVVSNYLQKFTRVRKE